MVRAQSVLVLLSLLASTFVFSQSVAEIRDELIDMMGVDQQGREEISKIRAEFGNLSSEVQTAWERQSLVDAAHMARLEEVVSQFGWPTISTFGPQAATAAFLILQHSELDMQQKYLAVFRDAAQSGEARGSSYALLYDRILMGEGKRQLYGSQVRLDEASGDYYLWPIENEANVDQRRAELDMQPLAEYLKLFPFDVGSAPDDILTAVSK